MKIKLFGICIFFNLVLTFKALAVPTFQDLVSEQVQGIIKDLSTSFFPTTVTPARSLGEYWGVELGMIAGVSDSPYIDRMVPEDFPKMPHGAGLVRLGLPFGIGAELAFMPVKTSGIEYNYYNYGLQWTFTDLIKESPIDARFRVQFVNGSFSYTQYMGPIPIDVEYTNKAISYNLTVSKKILFIEPFIYGGYIYSVSDLNSTGNISIFNINVPISYREGVVLRDTYVFYGVQLNLFALKLAFETGTVFDNQRTSFKLSLAF